ncbi:hypothetical protein Tco_1493274 [Tanacetum coccineum]
MGWIDSFVSMVTEVVKGVKEKDEGSVTRAEESSSKRAGTELEQEIIKKKKIDDDQEEAEMKKHMEIFNPTHAYYNGSRTSKDNEDPCWNTSFKTRRTQKTTSAVEALWKTILRCYLYLLGTLCLPSSKLLSFGITFFYLPSWKRYRGTSELVEDSEEEDDEEIDESMDSDSLSEDAKDEGPTAEDEDPAAKDEGLTVRVEGPSMDDESYGLDSESHGIDNESRGLDNEGHSVESD